MVHDVTVAAINEERVKALLQKLKALVPIDNVSLTGVSNELSRAVGNIFSNGNSGDLEREKAMLLDLSNRIAEKEEEKSILLDISNEFSVIRTKNDFQNILQERLRKLFYFSHTLTLLSDSITQTYTGYIFDPMSLSRSHPDYMLNFHRNYPLNHPVMNMVVSAKEPIIFDLEELIKRTDLPAWIQMNYECGVKEIVITELYVRNKHLGFYVILSDEKGRLTSKMLKLIQGIASQTSIAVANLIANEELSKKENEKSTLLELSSEIAKIRNKSDLQKIIDQKVRKLLQISHYAICLINEDEKGYFLFINDENAKTRVHKDYAYATSPISLNKPGLMSIALTSQQPVVFDLNELIKIPEIPDIFKINHEMGIKEVVFSSLDDSKRKIGFLVLFYKSNTGLNAEGANLIKGISAQLSTAITNIISNERIVEQLDEISKYKKQLEEENQYLQEEIHTTHNYSEIIGSDKSMEAIFRLVSQVADTNSSVLILGETGTGKELIARAIHNSSIRKDKVMVKVNCASLPANLVESELFGHERGSFTGATERRIGKFELANNSTLFLDEVGELPLDLQVKLLRALQEKEIERVGGKSVIRTNVRIIAATNRDLKKEVQLGTFRSDLYFRLNVFPIILPALRDRKADIPELAQHFLQKYSNKALKVEMKFSSRVMKQLIAYQWPGNVRELEHLIERSILISRGPVINEIDLPDIDDTDGMVFPAGAHIKTLGENEREYIISILKKCNGKIAGVGGAADLLKMPSTTLNSKIAKLKINKGLTQLKAGHLAKSF